MESEGSDMRRKHTEPHFWQYVAAYALMGAGTLLWLGELIAFWLGELTTFRASGTSGTGLVFIFVGLLWLSGLQNRQLKERIAELEKAMGVQKD
jgi:hypothetical protein